MMLRNNVEKWTIAWTTATEFAFSQLSPLSPTQSTKFSLAYSWTPLANPLPVASQLLTHYPPNA